VGEWQGQLFHSKPFLRFTVLMGPAGLLAILAGWLTTEIGRQPWVVYGVMRTKDAVSNHSVLALTTTLTIFVVMYFRRLRNRSHVHAEARQAEPWRLCPA
jgi:cytochrome d ubiquinol oxidase subunit I